jgi:formylglycine-generating enzyme required for sulfatase activity
MSRRFVLPWVLAGLVHAAAVGEGATSAGGGGMESTTQRADKRSAPSPLTNPAQMEFVTIPAGEFSMGCSPGDTTCDGAERPPHIVQVTRAFQIGTFEVTQAQWMAVMGKNPSRGGKPDYPVNWVSWLDVQEFLRILNARLDGWHYRLPTEAEWEYVARAGSTAPHPGQLNEMAWYAVNNRLFGSTRAVGLKQPNARGVFDMLGNVWEWVEDWYSSGYYATVSASGMSASPRGPASGTLKVVRGGSYCDNARFLRVSSRFCFAPDYRYLNVGFRCVREEIATR